MVNSEKITILKTENPKRTIWKTTILGQQHLKTDTSEKETLVKGQFWKREKRTTLKRGILKRTNQKRERLKNDISENETSEQRQIPKGKLSKKNSF